MLILNTKPKNNNEKKHIQKKKISLNVRSINMLFLNFKFKPNKTLNQHLLNPIKPKKLAINNNKKTDIKEKLIKPENT